MSTIRQNALFAAEQWTAVYDALTEVSFNTYSQDTLRNALIEYVRVNYPEEFNDWIGSSEFLIKIDILSWLQQNLAWRSELNSRENMLQMAERRESLLQLANNIAYKVSRVRCATGELKITRITTTQTVYDPDGQPIESVTWNDPTDPDWLEKWITVMNEVFSKRTPFGKPQSKYSENGNTVAVYRLKSLAPANGSYDFTASVGGQSLPFNAFNPFLNVDTGVYEESIPNPTNSFGILYRSNGLGYGSKGTGFFLPIKQGTIVNYDIDITNPISSRTINLPYDNVNDTDVFVTTVNESGQVIDFWENVDTTSGQSIGFQSQSNNRRIFEVLTRSNDRITIKFGDGKYGEIPIGRFRFWCRTSSPSPRLVKTADIQEKQITIPYVADSKIYNLTVTCGLTEDMTDAAASESNADIRYRANKVFYTQDRMVSAEDYNSYFFKDSSILKIAAVNRTYSGQGASVPNNDPTGTYSNVRVIGEDGRIYKSFVSDQSTFAIDTADYDPIAILDDHIQTSLYETDKSVLYHNEYPELVLNEYTWFRVDSEINGISRGRFMRDTSAPYAVPTGADAALTDALKYAGANTIVRLTDFRGEPVRVDYVLGNGTSTNGIVMKDYVRDNTRVYAVFPNIRQELNEAERAAVIQSLTLRKSFGLRWSQTAGWVLISPENIDTTSTFSLDKAGDVTETGKDASWMFRAEYRPLSTEQDRWVFYDRGLALRFESDRDVDFYNASGDLTVDAVSGRALRDSIKILRDNESRDSLPRRGFTAKFGVDPNQGAVTLIGDGTKTTFDLFAEVINEQNTFVTIDGVISPQTAWTILHVPGLDKIKFNVAPAAGASISVRHEPHWKYLQPRSLSYTGNDVNQVFAIGYQGVYVDNVWFFIEGVRRRPAEDFKVYRSVSLGDVVSTVSPPGNNKPVKLFALHSSGPAFGTTNYNGTGSRTTFSTNGVSNDVWVFVNGLLRTDYLVSKSDPNNYAVILNSPPAINSEVTVVTALWPDNTMIKRMTITATANQDSLNITSLGASTAADAERLLVWVNGSMSGWSYESGFIFFDNPLAANTRVHVSYFASLSSPEGGFSIVVDGNYPTQPSYIGSDVEWWVGGPLYHDDGYTNPNGVEVSNVDVDVGGDADNPFLFRELVVQDGTDLVLWRRINRLGADEWEPVSESTIPMATYENFRHTYVAGDEVPGDRRHGDIHYDGQSWLIADADANEWVVASDQSAFKKEIGRSGLRFQWNHYSVDGGRIDASASNIIDVYALTSGYDTAVRDWARLNRPASDFPRPESSDSLTTRYSNFNLKKMISDTLIWRSAVYKPLFGSRAQPELRARIIVVSVQQEVAENDIKSRVLNIIDDYFDYTLWDFGSTFYFSELAAYIHGRLPTIVQSVVIVPRSGVGNFGRLFQVRSEPNELFISAAGPEDIEIARSLIDSDLKIT